MLYTMAGMEFNQRKDVYENNFTSHISSFFYWLRNKS